MTSRRDPRWDAGRVKAVVILSRYAGLSKFDLAYLYINYSFFSGTGMVTTTGLLKHILTFYKPTVKRGDDL